MQNDHSGLTAATDVNRNGQSFDSKVTDLVIRLTVVGLFAYLSLTLLAPFVIMIIWAVILAVALYPAFAALRKLLGGHGGLAATLITLLGLVIIVAHLGLSRSTSPKPRWAWSLTSRTRRWSCRVLPRRCGSGS